MQKFKLISLFLFFAITVSSQTQIRTCETCDGKGITWQRVQYWEYTNLRETPNMYGGYDYNYDSREQITRRNYAVKCPSCNGTGKCVVKVKPFPKPKKKVVRYISSQEMMRYSYNKAKNDFPKYLKDLGEGYMVAKNQFDVVALIKLKKDEVGYHIIKVGYDSYTAVKDPEGNLYAHKLTGVSKGEISSEILYDTDKKFMVESKGGVVLPTFYQNVFWVYNKSKEPKLFDVDKYNYIKTSSLLFPDTITSVDYSLYASNLYPAQTVSVDFRGRKTYAWCVFKRDGNWVVPPTNKKILNFDSETNLIETVNIFGFLDKYDASTGSSYEPSGEVIKTCPNGGEIVKTNKLRFSNDDYSGKPVKTTVYAYREDSTGLSIPFILKNCDCRDNKGYIEVGVFGQDDSFVITPENKIIPIDKNSFNPLGEKISFKTSKRDNFYKPPYLLSDIVKGTDEKGNIKYGHKKYKDGALLFDDISSNNSNFSIVKHKGNISFIRFLYDAKNLLKTKYKNIDYSESDGSTVTVQNEKGKWGVVSVPTIAASNEIKKIVPVKYDKILFGKEILAFNGYVVDVYSRYGKLNNTFYSQNLLNTFSAKIKVKFPEANAEFFNAKHKWIKENINTFDNPCYFWESEDYQVFQVNGKENYSLIIKQSGNPLKINQFIKCAYEFQNTLIVQFKNDSWGIIKLEPESNAGYTYMVDQENGFDSFFAKWDNIPLVFENKKGYYQLYEETEGVCELKLLKLK